MIGHLGSHCSREALECVGVLCCLANHRHGDSVLVQSGYIWVEVMELQQAVDIILFVMHSELLAVLSAVCWKRGVCIALLSHL